MNAGGLGGGGTDSDTFDVGIAGWFWSFCCTWLYVDDPMIGRTWCGTNKLGFEISASNLKESLILKFDFGVIEYGLE